MERIKAEAFSEYMNDYFPETKVITVGSVDVTVRRHISIDEMIGFVDFVVNNCFQDDNETYLPELKDFLVRVAVIQKYTNIELPESYEDQYNFVYGSDLVPMIIDEAICHDEFKNMMQAIDAKIGFVESVEHREYKKKIDEIYSSLMSLTDQVSQMYSEMSPDELTNLVKVFAGMSDGSVNDEEITKAMMRYKESQNKEGDE